MADPGKIYVLTNPCMRGLVKIGCTAGTIEDRIKQLSGATGVPVAFKCHFAAEVDDMTDSQGKTAVSAVFRPSGESQEGIL